MKLSCSSSTLALVAALLTLAVDVQAAGAATRTIPRTVPTWADLADEDIRGFWQSVIVLEDGGVAVAKTLTEVTNSYPWAVSSDYDKLARTDASGGGKWIRQFDGDVNVKWTGAALDGVTNDDSAWESAITVAEAIGCGVYMPAGTSIVSTLSITPATVNIAGESMDDCVIEADSYGTSSAKHFIEFADITSINIQNITFTKGWSVFYASDPASFDHEVSKIELRNVKFIDSVYGLFDDPSVAYGASAVIDALVIDGLYASAATTSYVRAGLSVLRDSPSAPLPIRRLSLRNFDFQNITEAVYYSGILDNATVSDGVVHGVNLVNDDGELLRGNIRGLSFSALSTLSSLPNVTVSGVTFRDYTDTYSTSTNSVPSTIACIYDNGANMLVLGCKFLNVSARTGNSAVAIDTKGQDSRVIVDGCWFEDQNGRFVKNYYQSSRMVYRNNVWRNLANSGTEYLISGTASASPTLYLELSGNTFTNITATQVLRASTMASTGVAIFENNRGSVVNGQVGFGTTAFKKLTIKDNVWDSDDSYGFTLGCQINTVDFIGNRLDNTTYGVYINSTGAGGTYTFRDNTFSSYNYPIWAADSATGCTFTFSGNVTGGSYLLRHSTSLNATYGSGETSTNQLYAPVNKGDVMSYHGSIATESLPTMTAPGDVFYDSTKGALTTRVNNRYIYHQPLAEVTSGTLSGSVWLTPRADNSVQIVSSAASTPELLLSATNAVAGTVWRVVNQDGANTLDVDNTDGSTLIKTIGTSSWAEFRWTGSTYVLVGYGGL